jgi:hypothetical protein
LPVDTVPGMADDATAFQVGPLEAAARVAWLLIGPPVGAWMDRWRRRPVRVIASAASFLAETLGPRGLRVMTALVPAGRPVGAAVPGAYRA